MTHLNRLGVEHQPQPKLQTKAETSRTPQKSEDLFVSAVRTFCVSVDTCHALSVADAWIAAAARQEGAVLVHKDPEFQAITSLPQEWLS
jgi:predicted nucleic acid-binding protein